MTWGQFIRWADPEVEEDHYHLHVGDWPHPNWAEWLQWTASPPNVADLDLDGKNEVLGVPNIEKYVPYVTQAYAIMVLEGSHGDGSRSAMRKAGWEILPRGDAPIYVSGWYPPMGVPAAVTADIQGDDRPEIVVSFNDGHLYAYDAQGNRLWRYNYTRGYAIMFSSESLRRPLITASMFSPFPVPRITGSSGPRLAGTSFETDARNNLKRVVGDREGP